MSEVIPRITGTEMEWSIRLQKAPGGEFKPTENPDASVIISARPKGLIMAGQWMRNGGRMYPDVGGHLEYATPEDASFMGTVTNEIAGERNVYDALCAAQKAGKFLDFKMNKRVVDESLQTWGYHVSFCAPANRMRIDQKHLTLIGLHLATMNLYAGAGAIVGSDETGWDYRIGQKVLNLNCDFALSSHSTEQPLLSTRDEPHSDDNWKRVHLTSMDANVSPWASWIKLPTTSLVMRLVERGYYGDDLQTEQPMFWMARQVAEDMTMRQTVRLKNGKSITPLDLQGVLYEKASRLTDVPDEEQEGLQEWGRALEDLETDFRLLRDRSDWVMKYIILQKYMDKHGLKLGNKEVRSKDRQWDNMGPDGIGLKLRKKSLNPLASDMSANMPKQSEIRRAQYHPPENTRAKIRGNHILTASRMRKLELLQMSNWYELKLPNGKTVNIRNPYLTSE